MQEKRLSLKQGTMKGQYIQKIRINANKMRLGYQLPKLNVAGPNPVSRSKKIIRMGAGKSSVHADLFMF